jgi:hypothetical protein
MADPTILGVMPKEDLQIILDGVQSGELWAVRFLEDCLAYEIKDPVPGTEEETKKRVSEIFHSIVPFSLTQKAEESQSDDALMALNHLTSFTR